MMVLHGDEQRRRVRVAAAGVDVRATVLQQHAAHAEVAVLRRHVQRGHTVVMLGRQLEARGGRGVADRASRGC